MNLDAFRNAFSQGPVCIFLWENATGVWPVADVTPNVEALTGWPASHFVDGRVSFAEMIHPDDLARVGREGDAWKKKRSITGINLKYRILTKSGAVRHVSEFTQTAFDEDGEVTGFSGYVVDVTGYFESEEARIAAEQAAEAKTQFLANMSHEIRTPMNGVMGLAELLKHTDLNDEQASYADMILRSGSALLTVINDLLDFSNISSGQFALEPMPFNLRQTVQDVMSQYSAEIAVKGLRVSVDIDAKLPKLFIADPQRIHQILTNIVGNAVKFTHHGEVTIDVSGRVGAGSIATLDFIVTDTGVGIPDCKKGSIFEMFSQADGSMSRMQGGLGLGLSIAASLVDKMGGKICVQSQQGTGSVFTVTLPMPVETVAGVAATIPDQLKSARVLVVADPVSKTGILHEYLGDWGFETATVTSGVEALVFLQSAKRRNLTVDLVIIDDHVRLLNGLEVVRAIKGDPVIANAPLLVLADGNEARDVARFKRAGVHEVLRRSVTAAELRNAIVETMLDELVMQVENGQAESGHVERGQALEPEAPALPHGVDVLIVEDNLINQVVLKQILVTSGYSVEIAVNGQEGVDLYRKIRPALICMDVSMPVMSGLDATRAIRALEVLDGTRTPIIGVTAHAINGDKDRCIAAGMDDYVPKPISPKTMKACLDRWLSRPVALADVKSGQERSA